MLPERNYKGKMKKNQKKIKKASLSCIFFRDERKNKGLFWTTEKKEFTFSPERESIFQELFFSISGTLL